MEEEYNETREKKTKVSSTTREKVKTYFEAEQAKLEENIRKLQQREERLRKEQETQEKNYKQQKQQENDLQTRDDETQQIEEEKEVEEYTSRITKELETIVNTASREVQGKLSLDRTEQNAILSATITIQESIIGFLSKLVKLGKKNSELKVENILLKKQLEQELQHDGDTGENEIRTVSENKNKSRKETREHQVGKQKKTTQDERKNKSIHALTSSETEQEMEFQIVKNKRRKTKTYANANEESESDREGVNEKLNNYVEMSRSPAFAQNARYVMSGRDGWKTPPAGNTFELMVDLKEEGNVRVLAEKLGKEIKVEEIGGTPLNVKYLRNGGMKIQARNLEQLQKMEEVLGAMKDLKIRTIKNSDPMFVVTGVGRYGRRGIHSKHNKGKLTGNWGNNKRTI